MAVDQEVVEAEASRFPFISLAKAIERARELHKNAGNHAAMVSDLPKLWGYTDKASGWRQTLAALKYYGLTTDTGSKDRRQVRLTDDGRRYFLDERPEVHDDLHRKFALQPRALANLWSLWHESPPTDPIARSKLKVEFGYAENAAADILSVYKANLAFAKLAERADDSRVEEVTRAAPIQPPAPPPSTVSVRVGDYVQWTSDGQEQFAKAKQVVWCSEDGTHARVFGSSTGVRVSELVVTEQPRAGVHLVGKALAQAGERVGQEDKANQIPDLSVLLRGNRLEITADVDRAGLERLKEILGKYEEILKIIDPDATTS